MKWAKNLKVVQLFVFWTTSLGKKLIKNGEEIPQNYWVYEQALTVIPRDQITVVGHRRTPTANTRDLPTLPRVYRLLEANKNPPIYKKIKACDYHFYMDDHPEVDAENEYD